MQALRTTGSLLVVALGGLALVSVLALTVGAGAVSAENSTFRSPFHSPVPKPVTTSQKVPFDRWVWNPCTDEWVHLVGNLHTVFHISYDAKGGYHAESHFQPQGVRGYGETTGVKYRATGVTREGLNGKVGSQQTYVNSFCIIGKGKTDNYLVHQTFHLTINANGEVTAVVDNFRVRCK